MPSQIDYSGSYGSPYDGNKVKREEYRKINQSLSPVEKDRLHREMKDLEVKVSSSLMSKDDMWPGDDKEKLERNAHELLRREADPEYQRNYKRLKDIRMKLDPDDPTMGSPEYLRGSKYKSKGAEAHKLAKWS